MATGRNIMSTLVGILINYYWKKCLFCAEFSMLQFTGMQPQFYSQNIDEIIPLNMVN